jgi:hypothetical protein
MGRGGEPKPAAPDPKGVGDMNIFADIVIAIIVIAVIYFGVAWLMEALAVKTRIPWDDPDKPWRQYDPKGRK